MTLDSSSWASLNAFLHQISQNEGDATYFDTTSWLQCAIHFDWGFTRQHREDEWIKGPGFWAWVDPAANPAQSEVDTVREMLGGHIRQAVRHAYLGPE